ncbi:Ig-like domain-containing protein [Streptomyces sp. B6B3]|uniref:L,D-transpeptidase n=1 Tax=Streptomyces sp. B6B3 TaxID=3153570 RepID=UPI00325D13A1
MSNDIGRTDSRADIGRIARTAIGCVLVLVPLSAGLAGCVGGGSLTGSPYDATEELSFGTQGGVQGGGKTVDPDEPLRITASGDGDSRITDVVATDADGRTLPGELTADGRGWSSTGPLAPDSSYTVRVSTENDDGDQGRGEHAFRTGPSDARELGVTLGPEPGEYGVGQPLTAALDRKISDPAQRALVESALLVSSEPAVVGSWYWVDDQTVHYRPKEYWPADASITVQADLTGLPLGEELRGTRAEPLEITTGDRIEAVADITALTMTVSRNGEELRTMPMTTGKEGFRTRDGKKVVLGQASNVRMTGTSIGIPAGSAESYDLNVEWATQLTWSGEYVHGAPWSLASHGIANVSHGCTGLSTENALWFYDLVGPGDIVEHVNGFGEDMPAFGNGFGDWNLSWEEWQQGSALSAVADETQQGHLSPTI